MAGVIEMLTENLERYKGKFFYSHNTSGTPVSSSTTCSTDPANPLKAMLIIENTATKDNSSSANTIVIPTYIRIHANTLGTSGTSAKFAFTIDTQLRYSSGGGALTTVQTRAGQDGDGAVTPTTAQAAVYFGNIVASAASTANARQVGTANFRATTASFRVGDIVEFNFGDFNQGAHRVATLQAIKAGFGLQPVFLEPQTCLIMNFIAAAQTASGKYDIEVGHIEIKNGSTY